MSARIGVRAADGEIAPVAFQIESGQWHSDGWMSSALVLRLTGLPPVRRLSLTAFVSDVSMRLYDNRLTLAIGGEEFSYALKWGGSTPVACALATPVSGDARLAIRTSGFLVPDALDSRERAVVIKQLLLAA